MLNVHRPFPCLFGAVISKHLYSLQSFFFPELTFILAKHASTLVFGPIGIQNRYFKINTNPQILIAFNETRFGIYMFIDISPSTGRYRKSEKHCVKKK